MCADERIHSQFLSRPYHNAVNEPLLKKIRFFFAGPFDALLHAHATVFTVASRLLIVQCQLSQVWVISQLSERTKSDEERFTRRFNPPKTDRAIHDSYAEQEDRSRVVCAWDVKGVAHEDYWCRSRHKRVNWTHEETRMRKIVGGRPGGKRRTPSESVRLHVRTNISPIFTVVTFVSKLS